MKTLLIATTLTVLFNLFSPSVKEQNLNISGTFLGQPVQTTVDADVAKYYFELSMDSAIRNEYYDDLISNTLAQLGNERINNKSLALVANQLSTDIATLYFAKEVYEKPKNKRAHHVYHKFLDQLSHYDAGTALHENSRLNNYLYVFIPGLFYKRHPEHGGDFARQRTMLRDLGLPTYLIETDEIGLIEDNARFIADELIELGKSHDRIILVSASKGGPDLAYAIGKIMEKDQLLPLKAWISIGGVLRGSPVADDYLTGLKRWFAQTALFFIGGSIEMVEDLSYPVGQVRYAELSFPEDLLIIHFVGAPLSGQVSSEVKDSYKKLSKYGPNDGLTILVDELTPQGVVITELGLDHYYRDPNIGRKSFALMYTAIQLIEKKAVTSSE